MESNTSSQSTRDNDNTSIMHLLLINIAAVYLGINRGLCAAMFE